MDVAGIAGCRLKKCAYIASEKALTKRVIFVYLCFDMHNFHLRGTAGALLDKKAYSANFRRWNGAFCV